MLTLLRNLVTFLLPSVVIVFSTLPFAAQAHSQESDRELQAGKEALTKGQYGDALVHFTRANLLQQEKCSECYVGLARLQMATGNLDQALRQTEQAVTTANNERQRASAELYRGIVLSQQGNQAAAEAALRAAAAANPACVECRFNLGFVLLKESKDGEGVAVLKSVAGEFAGTPRGREIQRFIDDPSRIRKDFAPEFSARLKSGAEINLDTLRGKVVLLDFWGTWCVPCRASLPLLKDLAAKMDPAKVAIVSIDEGDSRENWERFIEKNGMSWPQVYDQDLSLHHAFGVDGYPRYYILSKDGIILEQFKGWKQNGDATISDAIARALEQ